MYTIEVELKLGRQKVNNMNFASTNWLIFLNHVDLENALITSILQVLCYIQL